MRPPRFSAQGIVIACAVLAGGASYWALANRPEPRVADAGFWFEDVNYASPKFGAPVTRAEVETIARCGTGGAGQGIPRAAHHAVGSARRQVPDPRGAGASRLPLSSKARGVAGESRAVSGFGGQGAVSFAFLASGAVAYAPGDASRASMIEAIGRGIGRTAVHEFTHQFLPTAPIHESTDALSYEYASAARNEQYFGELRWDFAWPLLERRLR